MFSIRRNELWCKPYSTGFGDLKKYIMRAKPSVRGEETSSWRSFSISYSGACI